LINVAVAVINAATAVINAATAVINPGFASSPRTCTRRLLMGWVKPRRLTGARGVDMGRNSTWPLDMKKARPRGPDLKVGVLRLARTLHTDPRERKPTAIYAVQH
jgi:hypothetical protein